MDTVGPAPGPHPQVARLLLTKFCSLHDCDAAVLELNRSDRQWERVLRAGEPAGTAALPRVLPVDDPLVAGILRRAGRSSTEAQPPGTVDGMCPVELGAALIDSSGGVLAVVLIARRHPGEPDGLAPQFAELCEILAPAMEAEREQTRILARLRELDRQQRALRSRVVIDDHLHQLRATGGGLAAIVTACAELTGKSVSLFDTRQRLVTAAAPTSLSQVRTPGIAEILASAGPVGVESTGPVIVGACPNGGLVRRKILTRVTGAGETLGWLVIDEHPDRLQPIDEHIAGRVAQTLGAELLVQRRVARVAWDARGALARQLVHGSMATGDLRASGEYLGVDVNARRILAYVLRPLSSCSGVTDDQQFALELERELGAEVLLTRGSEGTLLLIEAPPGSGSVSAVAEVKRGLTAVIAARWRSEQVIVGLSSVSAAQSLSRAYREAREVSLCIDRFAPASAVRVLAVDDLGPARLFLANSESSAVRCYVQDVLGPLLSGDPGMADLLLTLQCFFDADRSVRASAARLALHENTIRLRLGRVHAATGLDVASNANDQLSMQTALLVLRLQGHDALPALDVAADRDSHHNNRRQTA